MTTSPGPDLDRVARLRAAVTRDHECPSLELTNLVDVLTALLPALSDKPPHSTVIGIVGSPATPGARSVCPEVQDDAVLDLALMIGQSEYARTCIALYDLGGRWLSQPDDEQNAAQDQNQRSSCELHLASQCYALAEYENN